MKTESLARWMYRNKYTMVTIHGDGYVDKMGTQGYGMYSDDSDHSLWAGPGLVVAHSPERTAPTENNYSVRDYKYMVYVSPTVGEMFSNHDLYDRITDGLGADCDRICLDLGDEKAKIESRGLLHEEADSEDEDEDEGEDEDDVWCLDSLGGYKYHSQEFDVDPSVGLGMISRIVRAYYDFCDIEEAQPEYTIRDTTRWMVSIETTPPARVWDANTTQIVVRHGGAVVSRTRFTLDAAIAFTEFIVSQSTTYRRADRALRASGLRWMYDVEDLKKAVNEKKEGEDD